MTYFASSTEGRLDKWLPLSSPFNPLSVTLIVILNAIAFTIIIVIIFITIIVVQSLPLPFLSSLLLSSPSVRKVKTFETMMTTINSESVWHSIFMSALRWSMVTSILFLNFWFPDGQLQQHGSILQLYVDRQFGIDGTKIRIQTLRGDGRNAP